MDTLITGLVDGVLVPLIGLVTAPIPFLASSGLLLALFAVLWAAVAIALVRDPSRVDRAWRRLRRLPLLVQAVAWVLFLPVLGGIALWRTSWPAAARVIGLAGIAGWNLLVLLPAR